MESYAHKAAKAIVVDWFRGSRDPDNKGWTRCLEYWWCPSVVAPHFGVWEEYPILQNRLGLRPTWDRFTFTDPKPQTSEFALSPPGYQQLVKLGYPPTAILDIAIQTKDWINLGIEIVHKHPPSARKVRFLKSVWLKELLVIPAAWVLDQVKPPEKVPDEFWVWR